MLPEQSPGIRCRTGQAFPSSGFNLLAEHVFHTVGPVYDETLIIPEREYLPSDVDKDALLSQCYVQCLELAEEFGARTIAFPAISCGVYGCPVEKGVEIALKAFRSQHWLIDRITLVMFSDLDYLIAMDVFNRN
jgi:O-acetyl-ADP-ribose deacetylase (regulator of RNase III)